MTLDRRSFLAGTAGALWLGSDADDVELVMLPTDPDHLPYWL